MSGLVPSTEVYATNDLVEALVREYLVKTGCSGTLEAFNKEKPKHANSITKREVLRKALSLDRAALSYKKALQVEALPSTLEVWVAYTMSKVTGTWADAKFQPSVPRPVRTMSRDEDPEDASAPVGLAASTPVGRRAPALSSSGGGGSPATAGSPAAPRPVAPRQGFGMSDSGSPSSISSTTRKMGALSVGGTARQSSDPEHAASPAVSRPPPPRAALNSTAPARPAAAARPAAHHGHHHHHHKHNDLVMEDVDDDLGLDEEPMSGGTAVGFSSLKPGGLAAASRLKPGTPLPPDTARQLKALLWGNQGVPPPSWKQGFFFCSRPGLQFGLVQKLGGPCGVLAGVQAHVLAALHDPATGFNISPKAPEQASALTIAIAEALWQARSGSMAPGVLVLPDAEVGRSAGGLGYDSLARQLAQHSANSKEQLVDLVRAGLPMLMSEDGWGVVLFVLSIVLTRGIPAITADMDEASNSLMGMHGYCTQELVNLILIGTAVSNVFDGTRSLDGHMLKGVAKRGKLGLLTLFEWYKYVEVGERLKKPELPVWVVCSESHFTVLFAPDGRPLRDTMPFDLLYYDELANMEHVIKLTVSKDPKGGWTARVGDTIGDRGKCEGHNIPPLECVIETRWPGVAVNWNGSEPIL